MATNYSKNGSTYWRETGSYGLNDQGKRLRREFLGSNRKKAEYKKKAFEHLMFYGLDYHEASEIYDDPTFQKKLDSGITLTDIEAFIRVKSESSNLEMPSLELSMKSWLFDVKRVSDDVKPSSFERYEGLYRHYIVGWPFSQKPYNLITSNDLQRHYNHQFENCGKSHNIIKETNKLIKAYYNYEIVQERVATNPAAGKKISIPGASDQKKRTEIMSSEDLKRFISALSGHRLEMFFILAMSTGMRIGELIALKLEDVDLEKGKISVSATQYACNVFDSEGNKKFKTMRNSTKNRLDRKSVV